MLATNKYRPYELQRITGPWTLHELRDILRDAENCLYAAEQDPDCNAREEFWYVDILRAAVDYKKRVELAARPLRNEKTNEQYIDPQIVKQHSDLLRVIERSGIELKKSGRYYKALCPFHGEHTPSFYVFGGMDTKRSDERWHCFGCGKSGDVFSFVMNRNGVQFWDAVKIVADWSGIRWPEPRKRDGWVTEI